MILRRVIKHVTDQNWLAVFIDFLIVVIGIFVGLQVQEWSVQQSEKKLEAEYLQRILADVNRSISSNKFVMEFNDKPTDDVWLVYKSLQTCELAEENKDKFANGIAYIGRVVRPSFIMGTVNEMQSAGHFRFIRNFQIRDLINELEDSFAYEAVLFPSINTRLGPSLAYMDRQTARSSRNFPMGGEVKWSEMEIDFETLCKDNEFLGALSMSRNIREVYMRRIILTLELLEKIREALINELGVHSVTIKQE